MASTRQGLPKKRTRDLVEVDLGDEVLVYDQTSGEAHALNGPAAVVWRGLDGTVTAGDLATRLRRTFGGYGDDAMRLALRDFARHRLLDAPLKAPARTGVSRRQMLRRMVAAGIVVPAVASIATPHAQGSVASATACNNPGCGVPNQCLSKACCFCFTTVEGPSVCVFRPSDACSGTACTSSSQCPPGFVCSQTCCATSICVPICTPSTLCPSPMLAPGQTPQSEGQRL